MERWKLEAVLEAARQDGAIEYITVCERILATWAVRKVALRADLDLIEEAFEGVAACWE